MLKIGWQPGSRSMVHISRKLSQYSAAQAENAGKLLCTARQAAPACLPARLHTAAL